MNAPRILQELSAGNLVIAPTDTIYGILADATNLDAIQKVFTAKQRNPNKPLLLLASDFDMLKSCVTSLSPLEEALIQRYLPGKLTILLPRGEAIPSAVTGNSPLVGIRIPDYPELRALIRNFGRPLISTSANLAGAEPITHPEQISPEMLQYISYVEDAGTIQNEPSSLIAVHNNQLNVLRSGTVATEIAAHWNKLLQSL